MTCSLAVCCGLLLSTGSADATPGLTIAYELSSPPSPLPSQTAANVETGVNQIVNGTPKADYSALEHVTTVQRESAAHDREVANAANERTLTLQRDAATAREKTRDSIRSIEAIAVNDLRAPDRRVYGPSQVAEGPVQSGPWVPIGHANKEEFFAIEKIVGDVALSLGTETPVVSSAWRSATEGAFPSRRHAFAALDLATTELRFARALSAALGADYYVQIELPGLPTKDEQQVYPFRNGRACQPKRQARVAGGPHTHAQLDDRSTARSVCLAQ